MLTDTIRFFNLLSSNDQKQFDQLITFSMHYLENTLPQLTCLYDVSYHGIRYLCDVLDKPTIMRARCNFFNYNAIQVSSRDLVVIIEKDHDKNIDESLLKTVLHHEPVTFTRYGTLTKMVCQNKFIFTSPHGQPTLFHDPWLNQQYQPIAVCFENNPTNRLFCDYMVSHNRVVHQHIMLLSLLPTWLKLQYFNPFLIPDVIYYTINLLKHNI